MLHGKNFVHLHHGVHAHVGRKLAHENYSEEVMLRKARDYLPLLREREAFSHTSALLLYGVPILAKPELHVTAILPRSVASGRNVWGHRTRHNFKSLIVHQVLPCVPPEFALVQCESMLSFRELIVAIDRLVLPRREGKVVEPLISCERLQEYLADFSGKGAKRLQIACEISRVGAESRFETLSRFELARMGLDRLELQATLHDATGKWIGRFDLVDRETRKIVEYGGEQHRTDRVQYLRDEKKLQDARNAGYNVIRLHKEDLLRGALAATRRRLCDFLEVKPRKLPHRLEHYFAEPL